MNRSTLKKLIWLAIFSVAMAFLETAVVVYLRKLYYPEGFAFPLVPIGKDIATVEFFREVATIIMLLGAGIIAGKRLAERFAYFIFCFGIWDIFYYVFLKVLLGWPESWFTWDILFLVPVPWVGPVIAPVIVAVGLVLLAVLIVRIHHKGEQVLVNRSEWLWLIAGAIIIILSFMWDYCNYVLQDHSLTELFTLGSERELFAAADAYVPTRFNWWIFWAGELVCTVGILSMIKRTHILKS